MLAGDAAGNLTPLGVLASEPTKILMSRRGSRRSPASPRSRSRTRSISASVQHRAARRHVVFLQRADVPAGLEQISEAILVVVAITAVDRRLGRAHASRGVVASRTAGHQARRTIGRAGGRRSRSRIADLRGACNGPSRASCKSRGWEWRLPCARGRRSVGGVAAAPWRRARHRGRCVPDGECGALRHRCLQVRPVSARDRRNRIRRGRHRSRAPARRRRDPRTRPAICASWSSTRSAF